MPHKKAIRLLVSSKSELNLFIIFTKDIKSTSNSVLVNKTYFFTLFDENNEKLNESKIKEVRKFILTGNSILIGLTLSVSFFSFDFSSFFNFLNVVELLSIIFLFELDIPLEIKELLINLRVQKAIPNGLENFIRDKKNIKTDETLVEYGYEYSILILNSGNSLITLASTSLLVIAHRAFLSKIMVKFPKLSSIHQYLEYNILIKYWIQTSLELLITTTYGLTLFTNNKSCSSFDLSFCILIFVNSK